MPLNSASNDHGKKKSKRSKFASNFSAQQLVSKNIVNKSNATFFGFIIHGSPVSLPRHRVARSGHMYNPVQKQQNQFITSCLPYLPEEPLEGPLMIRLVFYFDRPLSHYGSKNKVKFLKDGMDTYHTKRKDLDNLVKFVLDALNKKAYYDDSQIAQISTVKLYTDRGTARTRVELFSLNETEYLIGESIQEDFFHHKVIKM